ncbi:MAG TPA: hypothetical protein VH008_21710 [Pseudonocardia sp.]|jgi:hypothetical protein|nr:hypothetical protein [Pseudonocardia sp.]
MQRLVRATVASAVAASAALLIGAGTANAATPAAIHTAPSVAQQTTAVLADGSVSGTVGDVGNVVGGVFNTLQDVLGLIGL